jgi:hypothetical protein
MIRWLLRRLVPAKIEIIRPGMHLYVEVDREDSGDPRPPLRRWLLPFLKKPG